jgi:hypothetical protein
MLKFDLSINFGSGALVVDEQFKVRLADLVAPVVLDVARPGAALDMQQLARLRVLELNRS